MRIVLLGIVFACWGAAQIRRLDGTVISNAEADAFARETLASASVTGAQIAVVDRGKLVWSAAYGQRRRDPPLAMDQETTTWAASITKSVFATYVMQLVERKEFDLNQPVALQFSRPLNEFEAYRDSASGIVKDPAWALVTPKMLLSHTSGLSNFASSEPDKKMRLHFKPGTAYLYSGEGFNLVQFLIERRFDKPIDDLIKAAIFKPLKMDRTGLIYRQYFAENVADRYNADGNFLSQTKRFPSRAAGSMTTSANDLARFASALMNGKIISARTKKAMFRPVIGIHSLHQFPLRAEEQSGTDADAAGLSYGIGWGLLTKTPFGKAFFKEGHGDGAQNYMVCFERQKACMILLTNSDNGELAFRPLLEKIFGDTATPWEWEGYTPEYISASRKLAQ